MIQLYIDYWKNSWENVLVDFWYIVMYLMIIPTISLIIRMVRKLVKK